ncbi:solute carrier family 22 member 12-like [Tropilaelaps mercedesae]|uniref:Solute carrier family 22 member 12-like n=1 Tax=Tropilaelaps mercedesae TaxID=418985 RepID=A0A1V9XM94_9ACAR|nr:solute carrier family 22 member 12-like [Tropilaelaps mercedesae]
MCSNRDERKAENDGDLTVLVGKVRTWHLIILVVIFVNSLFNAFGQLAMAFILPDVSYSCSRTEDAVRIGLTQEQWVELTQAETLLADKRKYCFRRNVTLRISAGGETSSAQNNDVEEVETDGADNSTTTSANDAVSETISENFVALDAATTITTKALETIIHLEASAAPVSFNTTDAVPLSQSSETLFNITSEETRNISDFADVSQWHIPNDALIPCTSWTFDRSVHRSTILEQWRLICDRENLQPFPQALSMAGLIVGNMIFSHFSDHYGRRIAVYSGTALCALAGLTAVTTSNFFIFNVARFFSSVSKIGIQASVVIFLETSDSSSRWMFSMLNGIGFHVGMVAVAVTAYYAPSWRYLQGMVSAPAIVIIPFLYFVWESPRWLLSKKRIEQGVKILARIAAMNGISDEQITAKMPRIRERYGALTTPEPMSAADLFASSASGHNMARVTLILWYLCFSSGLLFYSAVFLSTSFGDRPHTMFCVPILGEFCAIFLLALGIRFVRRRLIVCTTATLSALGFMALALSSHAAPGRVRVFIDMSAVVLVRSSTAAFSQLYPVYGAELYSTPLRNVGISFCDLMCRLASTIDPFGRYWLPRVHQSLLPSLYAGMGFLAAGMALLLPETMNQELDDSIFTRITTTVNTISNNIVRRASVFPVVGEKNENKAAPNIQASQSPIRAQSTKTRPKQQVTTNVKASFEYLDSK